MRPAVPKGVQKRPGVVAQPGENELRSAARCLDVAALAQELPHSRHGADHEAVPVREDLVVGRRPLAAITGRQKRRAHGLELPSQLLLLDHDLGLPDRHAERFGQVDDVAIGLERRAPLQAVDRTKEVSAGRGQRLLEVCLGPRVVRTLVAVRLGIDGGEKAALGRGHLSQYEVQREARHPIEPLARGEGRRLGVEPRQRRVVVQHLLEVRDEPVGVGRVAVKAPGQVVHHPAAGHVIESDHEHAKGPARPKPDRAGNRGSRATGTWGRGQTRPAWNQSGRRARFASCPRDLDRGDEPPAPGLRQD